MSIAINQCNFAGYLTRDAEVVLGDKPRAKFGVAVNGYKDTVLFMDCTAWGKLAENVGPNLKKGQPIFVTGELQLDEWEDSEGNPKSKPALNVRDIRYLSSKGEAVNNAPATTTADIPF
jgi:single-strand DNA-binding protein